MKRQILKNRSFCRLSSVLETMKQKTYNEVLLFINKTVDGPCIASRRASISWRDSEDEFFSQCRGKSSFKMANRTLPITK